MLEEPAIFGLVSKEAGILLLERVMVISLSMLFKLVSPSLSFSLVSWDAIKVGSIF